MKTTRELFRDFFYGDPRNYQILALGSFLSIGLAFLGFEVPLARFFVYVGICLWTQMFWSVLFQAETFQWKSALITSFSLSLLMRTMDLYSAAAIAALAISSKFLLRTEERPIFNPAHFGICMGLLFFPGVWVSPGQWGSFAFMALLALCVGSFVSGKSHRLDVSFSFLLSWSALLLQRSFYLNEPMSIPLHRLQTGALLLFSFHMISDPMTTPRTRWGRILYGMIVAYGAYYVQFKLFRTNGMIWSLLVFTPLVRVIDLLARKKEQSYDWANVNAAPVETRLIAR